MILTLTASLPSGQANLSSLLQLLKWKKLCPPIARRVSLPQVPVAHAKLEAGEVRGHVVCLPWRRVGGSSAAQIIGASRSEEDRE